MSWLFSASTLSLHKHNWTRINHFKKRLIPFLFSNTGIFYEQIQSLKDEKTTLKQANQGLVQDNDDLKKKLIDLCDAIDADGMFGDFANLINPSWDFCQNLVSMQSIYLKHLSISNISLFRIYLYFEHLSLARTSLFFEHLSISNIFLYRTKVSALAH